MDFRRSKLRWALTIMLVGWAVALAWHGWQGVVLHRGYPYGLALYRSEVRFSDYTDTLLYMTTGAPYRLPGGRNNHFPADYVLFRLFARLPEPGGAEIFVGLAMIGVLGILIVALQSLFSRPLTQVLAALPFLLSYPCLYGYERANSEIYLAFFIGLGLLLYWKQKFTLSFLVLLLPVCFKVYPVVLMLLFVRRRLIGWVVVLPFAFALITWLSLFIFIDPPLESLHWLGVQLVDYNTRFNLGQDGIGASASAWNPVRFGAWASRAIAGDASWPLPIRELLALHRAYMAVMVLLGIGLAFHVLLIERTFARRAILLLLFLTYSVPGGGVYKLMHVVTALVVMILIPQHRRFDLAATAVLAFATVPKQEVIWTYFGVSDSTVPDCSIAVVLNPLAMLVATGLLIAGRYSQAPLRLRWRNLLAALRFPTSRFNRAGAPALSTP